MAMISPRKASDLNLIPEEAERKINPAPSKSCESLYSNSSKGSANDIYGRKQYIGKNNKPVGIVGTRQPTIIPATNEVRQRVLSARRLRMKTFQNQLADAQQTIAELAHENRILRTLHKRQDSALSKYESNNAELPQLLHSHAEELRVWQTKYRNLQVANKELEQKLKQKEAVILSLSDQNKHFTQLNKDKNLEDRQRLTEKLQMLEIRLQEKDNDIKMLARKMQLETKQSKQQLQVEQKRNKEILLKLEKARLELSGYRKLEEMQLQEKLNMQPRRNRGSNNDISKDDKYALTNSSEAEITADLEAPNSQRSTISSSSLVQHTTRSIKNSTTKDLLTLSSSSTTEIQQVLQHQTPPNKSIPVLRHTDQGDGDTANVHSDHHSFKTSLIHKQQSNLSSTTTSQDGKFEHYYKGSSYENYVEGGLEDSKDCEENLIYKQDDSNANGAYVNNIDGSNEGIVNVEYEDYHKEIQRVENHDTDKKTRMKEEISNIRKQISDDYKEREAFLDNFCRQATNGILSDDTPKKRNITGTERNMASNRKHKLLAALKAIDDNKSQD